MLPFRLQDLPQEVRDQVYINLPLSDKSNMLMTCRSTKSEVAPLFYKEAVFKLRIHRSLSASPGSPAVRRRPRYRPDKIQNLDVFWDLRGDQRTCADELEAFRTDASTHQKRCRIFFAWDRTPAPCLFGNDHLQALESVAGFETVEVRLRRQSYSSFEYHYPVKYVIAGMPRDVIRLVSPLYDALRQTLEPAFGVAALYGDEDSEDHYLKFHPRRQ